VLRWDLARRWTSLDGARARARFEGWLDALAEGAVQGAA